MRSWLFPTSHTVVDGITQADIGRHREVWAGQRLGCVVHDLLSLPVLFFRPAFKSHHHIGLDHLRARGRPRGW